MGIINKETREVTEYTVGCDYMSIDDGPCPHVYSIEQFSVRELKLLLGSLGWRVFGNRYFCPECVERLGMVAGYYSKDTMRLETAKKKQQHDSESRLQVGTGPGMPGWDEHCRSIMANLDKLEEKNGSD